MFLAPTESAHYPGNSASGEAEHAYLLMREKSAICAPTETDVHQFHDALGRTYPLNWACSEGGECETFMCAVMYCGNVTEIHARIGVRYFRMRDYSNLSHMQIMARVNKEVLNQDNSQK